MTVCEIAVLELRMHELLGFELRPAVPHVRVVRRVLREPIRRRIVRTERRVRGHVHEAHSPRPAGAIEGQLRSADVDVEQLADRPSGWMTAAAWNTVARTDAVEQPVERRRVAHVADDRLDRRAGRRTATKRRLRRARDIARVRRFGASACTRFCPSHPAAPVTTAVDVTSARGSDRCSGPRSS